MKELFSFCGYHQLPEDPLVKQIMRVTNLGAVPLILNTVEWKGMFGLIQDPNND